MRSLFHKANFDQLAELWQEVFPERYWVDAEMLRLNTVECPIFDWGASFIEESPIGVEGYVIVKRSPSALYRGPERDQMHVSAIVSREPSILVDLMADVKKLLRDRGASKIVFGQDSRHFFPGAPVDCNVLNDFLKLEGFRPSGEQVDLEHDLANYAYDKPAPEGYTFRVMKATDRPALDAFFYKTFPGRWHYDVTSKVAAEGPETVFIVEAEGVIEGFALIQDSLAKVPIGGAVWRHSLGENWGGLGPIGVSTNVRGQGVGGALLGLALLELKKRGVRRCIIDWTSLVDFYGKFGFEVARRYHAYTLPLE